MVGLGNAAAAHHVMHHAVSVHTDRKFRKGSLQHMGILLSDADLKLPEERDIVHHQAVKMLATGDLWTDRKLMLSADKLSWTHQDNNETCIDYVPLIEITLIEPIEERPSDSVVPGLGSKGISFTSEVVLKHNQLNSGYTIANLLPTGRAETADTFFGFQVQTKPDGRNAGRTYLFEVPDQKSLDDWVKKVAVEKRLATRKHYRKTHGLFQRSRLNVATLFNSQAVSIFFALLIFANFVVNVIETQLVETIKKDPWAEDAFWVVDLVFTSLFTFELCLNMYGHLWTQFWSDYWNTFDFLVVSFSIAALLLSDIPVLGSFRLLRVFRVLRLFRKLKGLRIITNAIIASLFPVMDAVLILLVVTAVYAILAVEMYGEKSPAFKNFLHSMFSMYQVATGDSWASGIARELFDDDENTTIGVMGFFVSYALITAMILLNVVVAVLLDNFTKSIVQEDRFEEKLELTAHLETPLDPLLRYLSNIDSDDQIDDTASDIFESMAAGTDRIGFDEMKMGFERLLIWPKVHLTSDEYTTMLRSSAGSDSDGKFDEKGFQIMLRTQLRHYSQRMLTKTMFRANVEHPLEQQNLQVMLSLRCLMDQTNRITHVLDNAGLMGDNAPTRYAGTRGTLKHHRKIIERTTSGNVVERTVSVDDDGMPARVPSEMPHPLNAKGVTVSDRPVQNLTEGNNQFVNGNGRSSPLQGAQGPSRTYHGTANTNSTERKSVDGGKTPVLHDEQEYQMLSQFYTSDKLVRL